MAKSSLSSASAHTHRVQQLHNDLLALRCLHDVSDQIIEGEAALFFGHIKPVEDCAALLEAVALVRCVHMADDALVAALACHSFQLRYALIGYHKTEEMILCMLYAQRDSVGKQLHFRLIGMVNLLFLAS